MTTKKYWIYQWSIIIQKIRREDSTDSKYIILKILLAKSCPVKLINPFSYEAYKNHIRKKRIFS